MRIPIALLIYVSLTAIAVFECRAEAAPDWVATHEAGLAAFERRSYGEAADYFERSWLLSLTPAQRGVSANDLGQAYVALGRPGDARRWLERAYNVWHEDSHPGYTLAVCASGLGRLYRDAGDYARAETLLREALGASNPEPDSIATIRNSLADLLREEGRGAEAKELFAESLQQEGVARKQHMNALMGLAEIDLQTGDREASARKWNEVLEMARGDRDEVSEAIASRGLGSMWLSAGNLARAEPLLRRALLIMEGNPEAPTEYVATTLSMMAQLYRAGNKLALAEAAWSKALQLERTEYGELHPQVAQLMEMLAEVYASRGERDVALDYATRALYAMKRQLGEDALPTAVAMANRANVEQRANDLDAAAKDYEQALGIARTHPGHDPLEKAMIQRYAGVLKRMHRDRQAEELSALAGSFHPK